MTSQINSVVNELKRRIIAGVYAPGERLIEQQLAQNLSVSRTPIRLAFEELAKDGLIERLPTRGFRVKKYANADFGDAIDVRGTLEGMAARLVCERGLSQQGMQILHECIAEGDELLFGQQNKDTHPLDARRWMDINKRFHQTLIIEANSTPLQECIHLVSQKPLAAATALSLQEADSALEYSFLLRAHQDHRDLLEAIEHRAGTRAEFIMREHAKKTRENKERLLKLGTPIK